MSGSPLLQCPASARRAATSRTWTAVTSVGSSSGPSRTASSGRVHEVRPGPSAATKEYGQPGMSCLFPFPRAWQWQNRRSGLVSASGRSQLLTSAASRIRPSSQAGSGRAASAVRSRPIRTSPQFSASYTAPWPRRHSGSSDSSASMCTRSGRQARASHASNSASRRSPSEQCSSRRNPASRAIARSASSPSSRKDIMKAISRRLGVFKFFGRNPKIIRRRLTHVTTPRRPSQATQGNPDNTG